MQLLELVFAEPGHLFESLDTSASESALCRAAQSRKVRFFLSMLLVIHGDIVYMFEGSSARKTFP